MTAIMLLVICLNASICAQIATPSKAWSEGAIKMQNTGSSDRDCKDTKVTNQEQLLPCCCCNRCIVPGWVHSHLQR